ncbi:hypothetical protein EDD17DRAFT_1780857 [Pisolithus thermaeus]|nr:hypothetical protein EV401DRAFT_2056339 [Pisolithus croceorrhizus]KAI6148220.1 hypothetical protein EDD17DRAFT_1780857 [Pisolithus thermaeus]
MTTTYKETEVAHFILGETLGFTTTESFGMLPTLWQRFGHAAQDKKLTRVSILFAEKEFFDDEHSAHKRKGVKDPTVQQPPTKWARIGGPANGMTIQPEIFTTLSGMSVEEEASDSELDLDQEKLQDALDETARVRRSTGHTEKHSMDYLINAENRAGLECRWKVFDVCFENSAAALEEWREQTTAAVYGWHHLYDIGPSIMMCSAMLECIVDCAHHHKLSSIQDLKRETGWPDADQYRGEILSLIQRHVAPLASPFVSTPL